MDPNANLRQQEYLIDVKINSGTHGVDRKRARAELNELRGALKGWLQGGGFEPAWSEAPLARKYFRK